VTRYPKIRERHAPAIAGRLVNKLRGLPDMVDRLPSLDVSPDRWDNYLLALAQEGRADHLVTGDKSDLLSRHRETQIVIVRQMLEKLGGSGS